MNTTEEADLIHAYTRRQAIEDGEQIDVSEWATDDGFKWPVYMTRGAFAATITRGGHWVPDDDPTQPDRLCLPACQDERGRAHDVFWLLRVAIRRIGTTVEVPFSVQVQCGENCLKRERVDLLAQSGPIDIDNANGCITIMLPEEV